MENNIFALNIINEDTIQIYGQMNGFAYKLFEKNSYFYRYNVKFIKDNVLYKYSNDVDMSIHNIESLTQRLINIYNNCEKDN